MAETARPTAEEFDELAAILRRDPTSPAFVDYAQALLALGRPREAIDQATAGLRHHPDNHEGRLVLAQALAALHQWKEAQAELLRIVKVDRTNKAGFTLLGEVLLRRADYERATPVLQHAQNLDPSNPTVLSLLRAARAGQALPPPPPLPTPIAPRRAEPRAPAAPPPRAVAPTRPPPPAPPPARPAAAASFADDAPTAVSDDFAPPTYPSADPSADLVIASASPGRGDPTLPSSPPAHMAGPSYPSPAYAPPAAPPMAAPPMAAPPMAAPPPRPSAPPPAYSPPAAPPPMQPSGEPVRPRLVAGAKPANAAAAALRQSAAVGETYLNDLLTGGLLDVPGVRVPDVEYDLRPDRRWGRSTMRAFIVLFVLLVVGAGGGGYWYYRTEKQRAADVVRLRDEAKTLAATGSLDGLTAGLDRLAAALKRDGKNTRTFAAVAELQALRALLYGLPPDGVDQAIAAAARKITKPDQDGYRSLVIARTALALARLYSEDGNDANAATLEVLTKARAEIDAWVTDHPDDRWARYLAARGLLAAGARAAAADALRAAGDGADGLAVAAVERADLLVDDGNYDEAMPIYEAALTAAPDHPLALLGRSLALAERGTDPTAAIEVLNVKLDKPLGARGDGYRHLALAMAFYNREEPQRFADELARAKGWREPRFLARVALARALQGRLAQAATALGAVKWFTAAKPDPDPLVALVNGALQLAGGTPEAALDTLSKLAGTRAELLRGLALIDLGKYGEAQTELEAAQGHAPDSTEIKVWRLMAQTLAATGGARDTAAAELEKASRKPKSKIGRHAHGMTMLLLGNTEEARRRLEQALEDVSDAQPNPVAYRTRIGLAAIERGAGNLDAALTQVDEALKVNPGYLPARIEKARALVARGDGDAAVAVLEPVMAEAELLTGPVDLLAAEALIKRDQRKLREKDKAELRAQARALLERAKGKGADAAELARVAELVEPGLAATLGVATAEEPAPAPKRPTRRRRGR
ncbi:MAG: tetratricopeptide repeat protein [Kofleriaceae bacterium]|nr:tetratricopeptide repeat protein [Kofleriaceae bacterium]MBP9170502.1 tetratricopeptide repeat protein [Kofleriaceae bacterium]MBP9860835.1 tetratricopeptide repeat protein [Kofleriaceae bacterium]